MKVLVVNCGSSSIKYQLYRMPQGKVLAKGVLEKIGEEKSKLCHQYDDTSYDIEEKINDHEQGMELILNTLVHKRVGVIKDISEIGAVGHRVVHGGEEFTGSVIINEKVIDSIKKFSELAPLHNPHNLAGIMATHSKLPKAKQVACFDTAFHTTIPEVAYMYGLPYELYEKYGIRRYGFHGISHRYVSRQAAAILGKGKYGVNLITCHLGNGCSVSAVKNGKSIDTSMGFTPLEGLVMGTRSGSFDPAILFFLAEKNYSWEQLNELCNKESGLFGLSGRISNDMRNLEELAKKGNKRAKLAIDVFCYYIKKYIGAYVAILDTVDAVVFTGGIGENSVWVRQKVCSGLDKIGIQIDPAANKAAVGKEADIGISDSRIKTFVIPTNEEVAIAKDTYELARAGRSNYVPAKQV
jgi:acetate kinase